MFLAGKVEYLARLAGNPMRRRESEYLAMARRGFLATSRNNRVTVIPVCFAHHGDTVYTPIDRKPKGKHLARLSNIASNPYVAFLVDNYSEDWRLLSYLLIHGNASIVSNVTEARRARELLLRKYPQYRRLKLGDAPIVGIRVQRSKFWQFRLE